MNTKRIHLASVVSAVAAILFIASSGIAQAQNVTMSPRNEEVDPDLDIRMYGFAGKRAFIQVYGTAGGTLPEHHDEAIAYVLEIVTSEGINQTWAIDSHEIQHGDVGVGAEWHAHRVVVDEFGCLNEVDHVNPATVKNHHVWFENMVVRGNTGNLETVDAVEIIGAKTVLLHLQVEDPDNPPPGTECIALVTQVFDEA